MGETCCGPHCVCIGCTEAPGTGDNHGCGVRQGLVIPGEASVPASPGSLDVVRVRCAPNLADDDGRALTEALRALRPGGQLVVWETTWVVEPPAEVRRSLRSRSRCLSGAPTLDDYVNRLVRAGFREVRAERHPQASREVGVGWRPPVLGVEPTLGVVLTAIK